MKPFEMEDYKVFEMFNQQWGLVTAGDISHWNTCTIGWGESRHNMGRTRQRKTDRHCLCEPGPVYMGVSEGKQHVYSGIFPGRIQTRAQLSRLPFRT